MALPPTLRAAPRNLRVTSSAARAGRAESVMRSRKNSKKHARKDRVAARRYRDGKTIDIENMAH